MFQPRTTTYNYGRYEAETEPERIFRQPVYKPEYRPEYNEPSYPKQEYNDPSYPKPAERGSIIMLILCLRLFIRVLWKE